jgi:hypothetical protein
MRTISALIAATFCALALSGSAFAADRLKNPPLAVAPSWLELRTLAAVGDLWPAKEATAKGGRAKSPSVATGNPLWSAELEATASTRLQQGLAAVRSWGRTAQQVLDGRISFDVAEN